MKKENLNGKQIAVMRKNEDFNSLNKEKNLQKLIKGNQVPYDMVVFSHLRWDFVYQRPQHLISRFSKQYSILFIEEPIPFHENQGKGYELEEISPTLHVLKPRVNSIEEISHILQSLLRGKSVDTAWFYSAAFSVLIPDFDFDTIIYDCMDELSLFKGAPKELIHQEKFLLSKADIVFTGGSALYDNKCNAHSNVYCFPSSVDRTHFESAQTDLSIPEDVADINRPIVGYFGVIDERIDLDLLWKTALLLPKVTFLMIGPLAKIGEEDLPRAPNIHYLGMKRYEFLPNYLKVFDIAMMPFALNDATKYISPTKTLEYMAAGVPIISTAVKDVVRHYKDCTYIIKDEADFVQSIAEILYNKKDNRETKFDQILSNTSWDMTVSKMYELIKVLER